MLPGALELTLTPAAVKQEVNFLESSEISLHKTTVNLKTEDVKADLARILIKLDQLLVKKKKDWATFLQISYTAVKLRKRVQSVELQRGLWKSGILLFESAVTLEISLTGTELWPLRCSRRRGSSRPVCGRARWIEPSALPDSWWQLHEPPDVKPIPSKFKKETAKFTIFQKTFYLKISVSDRYFFYLQFFCIINQMNCD